MGAVPGPDVPARAGAGPEARLLDGPRGALAGMADGGVHHGWAGGGGLPRGKSRSRSSDLPKRITQEWIPVQTDQLASFDFGVDSQSRRKLTSAASWRAASCAMSREDAWMWLCIRDLI